jgi:hypothetical protein
LKLYRGLYSQKKMDILIPQQFVDPGGRFWSLGIAVEQRSTILQSPKPKQNRRACFSSNSSNRHPPT